MSENQKPATPYLDAARKEADALAKYEAEVAETARRHREEAPARAKATAERRERLEQRKIDVQKAVADAEFRAAQLVMALDLYISTTGMGPSAVSGHIGNFLAGYFRKYGPIDQRSSISKHDLLVELIPKMERAHA